MSFRFVHKILQSDAKLVLACMMTYNVCIGVTCTGAWVTSVFYLQIALRCEYQKHYSIPVCKWVFVNGTTLLVNINNHRASTSRLLLAGVPAVPIPPWSTVVQLNIHNNINRLNRCALAPNEQEKEMSNILL